MDKSELPFLSASELSRLIASREVSPIDATEAYLDRIHEDWREHRRPPPGASSDEMSEREARAMLGVGPEATREEIVEAWLQGASPIHTLVAALHTHPVRREDWDLVATLNTRQRPLRGE